MVYFAKGYNRQQQKILLFFDNDVKKFDNDVKKFDPALGIEILYTFAVRPYNRVRFLRKFYVIRPFGYLQKYRDFSIPSYARGPKS